MRRFFFVHTLCFHASFARPFHFQEEHQNATIKRLSKKNQKQKTNCQKRGHMTRGERECRWQSDRFRNITHLAASRKQAASQ
jgi:hypothetical protein